MGAEQPVTGALGLFARQLEPGTGRERGMTDCGQALTAGRHLAGTSWGRPSDAVGLAGLVEGLSPVARRYFAAEPP